MKIYKSKIEGCFEIQPQKKIDERGHFVKIFNRDFFNDKNLNSDWSEEYYSYSKMGVLRGLHFQAPPYDHCKLVYCVYGHVMDVVVDLRKKSSTYGDHQVIEITSKKANMVYIPKGLAHGFYTISQEAILVYKVSSVYAPDHDTGIHWNSASILWPDRNPIVSERDSVLQSFKQFESPF
jgi:dTDP-4-dehydrorhamnose 3,5-epimerase